MKQPSDFLQQHYQNASRLMIGVIWAAFLVCAALAPWYGTWMEWLFIGLPAALVPTFLYKSSPSARITRVSVGLSFMVFSALMIHQGHGMIEMHFAIFGLLAFLLYFKDWLPIMAAAGLIAVHHLSFNFLQAAGSGVFVFASGTGLDLVIIHAAFVVFETAVLVYMAVLSHREALGIAEMRTVTQHMTAESGRINLAFDISGLDSELGQQFERYFQVLKEAIRTVDTGTSALMTSSSEIAEGNSSLAQRIEEQANSLIAVSSSVKQITAAVEHNTEYTEKVNELAGHSARDANEGVAVVQQAIAAMADITQASNRIGEIITSIDEIAFQTNLLAINASIEAAHAGEQGKGFAVVAGEVRILAKRCADAAQETKDLIEDSLGKVERGNTLVNDAGGSLTKIAGSVRELSTLVDDITREGKNQQSGIQQINDAIQSMNDITQQNAALVEEIAEASRHQNSQTIDLNGVVHRFKIGRQANQTTASKLTAAKKPMTTDSQSAFTRHANEGFEAFDQQQPLYSER